MVELYEFMIARCAPEDLSNAYVKYSDYEALEAKLAALVEIAQLLVDHAQNADQELWASLPDVIALRDAIEGKEG